MATLADLKTRIISEMVREDLEDDLADQLLIHIQRACEFFADERFWFNQIVTTGVTVSGTVTAVIPTTVRRIDRLTIPALGVALDEYSVADLDMMVTASGQPNRYAYYNDLVRLYPTPGAVYTLRYAGLAQVAAPAVNADTSIWTNEAQDLIVARTRMTLYRDQFRDTEGTQLAAGAVVDALGRIQRETAKRQRTPLRSPPDAPWQTRAVDTLLRA